MKKLVLLLFSVITIAARAQNIIVPNNIYFADQHMIVKESGQKELQKKVDALLRYPKSFTARVELADTYFPLIERVFREEGLPEDFKYLVLIESGLIPDAVSTSNAVGFWQFKKPTALDYGLRVNNEVDERKHIIESSRSAARYLTKSNTLYYNNWHNTVLSYYHGFTGAKAFAKPEHNGAKEMEITDKSDVYILKLLAHKLAYEPAIGKNPTPTVMLQEVEATGKNLSDLALEAQTNITDLQKYNKWLVGNYIPNDKTYTVLIPVTNPEQKIFLASNRTHVNGPIAATPTFESQEITIEKVGKREVKKLNGLKVIIAQKGDTKDKLAAQAKMSTRKFLALNDMYSFDPIEEGTAYYTERKKSNASVEYHVVKQGERVHQIAQKYGVRVKTILWNNRMKPTEALVAGRLLWMQHRRPSRTPVEFQKNYDLETDPKPAPKNPILLAKDNVLDELNGTNAVSSQGPDEKKNPTKEYKGGKFSGKSPEKVAEVDIEPTTVEEKTETIVAQTETSLEQSKSVTDSPLDAAIAQTNEQAAKSETSLSQNIDKHVDAINKQEEAPLVYTKPKVTEPAPMVNETEKEIKSEEKPANKPVVILKESVSQPKVVANTPAAKEETRKPAPAVVKETIPAVTLVNSGMHIVAKGETLYGISKKYNITTTDIKTWNNLGESPLAIGQALIVAAPAGGNLNTTVSPLATPTETKTETTTASSNSHVVAAGESMYQISRKYGVTIKEIMEWNNKPDFNVSPGEKLVIKSVSSSRN